MVGRHPGYPYILRLVFLDTDTKKVCLAAKNQLLPFQIFNSVNSRHVISINTRE